MGGSFNPGCKYRGAHLQNVTLTGCDLIVKDCSFVGHLSVPLICSEGLKREFKEGSKPGATQ